MRKIYKALGLFVCLFFILIGSMWVIAHVFTTPINTPYRVITDLSSGSCKNPFELPNNKEDLKLVATGKREELKCSVQIQKLPGSPINSKESGLAEEDIFRLVFLELAEDPDKITKEAAKIYQQQYENLKNILTDSAIKFTRAQKLKVCAP